MTLSSLNTQVFICTNYIQQLANIRKLRACEKGTDADRVRDSYRQIKLDFAASGRLVDIEDFTRKG